MKYLIPLFMILSGCSGGQKIFDPTRTPEQPDLNAVVQVQTGTTGFLVFFWATLLVGCAIWLWKEFKPRNASE
jgi:hypothetical protein